MTYYDKLLHYPGRPRCPRPPVTCPGGLRTSGVHGLPSSLPPQIPPKQWAPQPGTETESMNSIDAFGASCAVRAHTVSPSSCRFCVDLRPTAELPPQGAQLDESSGAGEKLQTHLPPWPRTVGQCRTCTTVHGDPAHMGQTPVRLKASNGNWAFRSSDNPSVAQESHCLCVRSHSPGTEADPEQLLFSIIAGCPQDTRASRPDGSAQPNSLSPPGLCMPLPRVSLSGPRVRIRWLAGAPQIPEFLLLLSYPSLP